MAREESDREDLMREVSALSPRVEIQLLDRASTQPIVAGRRRDGGLSIYFGPDLAYHFDDEGRLRRAFVADRLYRSQGTTLARLTRERNDAEVQLLRHDLEPGELRDFLTEMSAQLEALRGALRERKYQVLRHVPDETDFVPELVAMTGAILGPDLQLAPAMKK